MRPDEHKSKESRRYQQRKKKEGDTTAAEIAEERRRRAKANDRGTSIAAIRRRNGELPSFNTATTTNTPPIIKTSQFSRRKITSNQDRYKERSVQDDLEQDAELGIDRETTDLVAMLEEAEGHLTGGSTYFKFKEEQELSLANRDEMHQELLQVDFDALDKKFQQTETRILLGLSMDDTEAIDYAFGQDYIGLDKPLIPATNKSSQGVVMLKSVMPSINQQQHAAKEDGLYIRNDRLSQRTIPNQEKQSDNDSKVGDSEKELDMLLGLGPKNKDVRQQDTIKAPSATNLSTKVPKPGMPKLKVPGSSSVQAELSATQKGGSTDDQAWLDDLLG